VFIVLYQVPGILVQVCVKTRVPILGRPPWVVPVPVALLLLKIFLAKKVDNGARGRHESVHRKPNFTQEFFILKNSRYCRNSIFPFAERLQVLVYTRPNAISAILTRGSLSSSSPTSLCAKTSPSFLPPPVCVFCYKELRCVCKGFLVYSTTRNITPFECLRFERSFPHCLVNNSSYVRSTVRSYSSSLFSLMTHDDAAS
jgi:hypothetical protein